MMARARGFSRYIWSPTPPLTPSALKSMARVGVAIFSRRTVTLMLPPSWHIYTHEGFCTVLGMFASLWIWCAASRSPLHKNCCTSAYRSSGIPSTSSVPRRSPYLRRNISLFRRRSSVIHAANPVNALSSCTQRNSMHLLKIYFYINITRIIGKNKTKSSAAS